MTKLKVTSSGDPLPLRSKALSSSSGAKGIKRTAHLSVCRRYRYALWRRWGAGPNVMFVGLNPSTAEEEIDDPTIRRCITFARTWGYGGLCMTNLFAYRSTQPAEMLAQVDPVGPYNDNYLVQLASEARLVVAAWGTHGQHRGRHNAVRKMLSGLHYLRLTKDGHPSHPLYLPANLRPVAWVASCPKS